MCVLHVTASEFLAVVAVVVGDASDGADSPGPSSL